LLHGRRAGKEGGRRVRTPKGRGSTAVGSHSITYIYPPAFKTVATENCSTSQVHRQHSERYSLVRSLLAESPRSLTESLRSSSDYPSSASESRVWWQRWHLSWAAMNVLTIRGISASVKLWDDQDHLVGPVSASLVSLLERFLAGSSTSCHLVLCGVLLLHVTRCSVVTVLAFFSFTDFLVVVLGISVDLLNVQIQAKLLDLCTLNLRFLFHDFS